MSSPCQCDQSSLFFSGGAHVLYGLIGIVAITLLYLGGWLNSWFLLLVIVFAAGSAVDLWTQQYCH
jgi:hypothetical protein